MATPKKRTSVRVIRPAPKANAKTNKVRAARAVARKGIGRTSRVAKKDLSEAYHTASGRLYLAKVEDALESRTLIDLQGKVDLLFTSPPFPLVRKKRYGNETGHRYLAWLRNLAPKFKKLLSPKGSLVIEIGNAWEDGDPLMSTLPLRALLAFKEAARLHLCQHVICHNPARLPGPAAWVTIERIRLKDSFTHVWWLSATKRPKAGNDRVLLPYSEHMKSLLARQDYNAGTRPSGHKISKKGFLKDHGGAIAPNVIDFDGDAPRLPGSLLQFTGTGWDSQYREYCKRHDLHAHPARMQAGLAAFFIQFLTDKGDLVFDPFAGSNTTGAVAEILGRRWIGVEANADYARGSRGRFSGPHLTR